MELINGKTYYKPYMVSSLKYGLLFLFATLANSSFGYPFNFLYVLTLFFFIIVLLNTSPHLYRYLIIFLTLAATLYLPAGLRFGAINPNTIVSILNTNQQETWDFLLSTPIIYYLEAIMFLAFGSYLLTIKLNYPTKWNKLFLLVVAIIILHNPIRLFLAGEELSLTNTRFIPLRFPIELINNTISVVDESHRFNALIQQQDTWQHVSATPKFHTYILVIGENVRRDFMHAYGFSIENTPFATQSNGLFFTQYLSASAATVPSLSRSLAVHSDTEIHAHDNIISLAKKAGFKTYWISNQGSLGEFDTLIASIGNKADSVMFFKKGNYYDHQMIPDTNMLPFIQTALADNTSQPKLIVIHLMGSHFPYCKRSQNQQIVFYHSKEISCYVKSILDTDNLLEKISHMASTNGHSWSMMYFSDHGVSTKKNLLNLTLTYSDQYKQNFQVPMFIISSDDTKKTFVNSARSAVNFLSLFAQWTGIQTVSLPMNCDYLSDDTCQEQTSVFLWNNKKVDISSLPNDPFLY